MKRLALFLALLSVPAFALDLGMNLTDATDSDFADMFADAWFQARPFSTQGVTVDANGWPTTAGASTYIKSNAQAYEKGTYAISATGNCTFTTHGSAGWTMGSMSYNTGTNTTSSTLTFDGTVGSNLNVSFDGCIPKSIHLMRPGTTLGVDTWNPLFLNIIKPYTILRMMGITWTNYNNTFWAGRTPTTNAVQDHPLGDDVYMGVSYEYVVNLCNTQHKDCWVNIPFLYDDASVTSFAQFFRDNLDPSLHLYVELSNEIWNGSFYQEAWNIDMADCETLAPAWIANHAYNGGDYYVTPAGNCYRVANGGTSNATTPPSYTVFEAANINGVPNQDYRPNTTSDGTATVSFVENINGKPKLNTWDGETNPSYLAWRRTGKRAKEISDIFRSVFGDAQMMTRVRPVLMGQLAQSNTVLEGLLYIQNTFPTTSLNSVFYCVGGAVYFDADTNTTTTDNTGLTTARLFGEYPASIVDLVYNQTASLLNQAHANGMAFCAYEGGVGTTGGQSLSVKTAAATDPRMQTMYVTLHKALTGLLGSVGHTGATGSATGVRDDVYNALSLANAITSFGQWGAWQDLTVPTPKSQSFAAFPQANPRRAKLDSKTPTMSGNCYGNTINSHTSGTGWYLNGTGDNTACKVNVRGRGTYTFVYNYSTGNTGGGLTVKVNNTPIATLTGIANTSGANTASATYYIPLNSGDNAIEFDNTGTTPITFYSMSVADH